MDIKNIFLIVWPIAVWFFSSFLTYWLWFKSQKDSNILKYKEERYSKLLYFLQLAYYRDWKDENHQKFIEEYMKCLLYSSNDVVKHLNDFMNWQSENKTWARKVLDSEALLSLRNIINAIRVDLWTKQFSLKEEYFRIPYPQKETGKKQN
jgi:hypothetical protein